MSKYDPLGEHLSGLGRSDSHMLTFDQIEAILGFSLPKSARQYQAWWANQVGSGHVQSNAWLDNGWHTELLSLGGKHVTFKPVDTPRAPKGARKSTSSGLSIDDAKRAIAIHYGVRADQVAISLRG
jgi:hypothetical protein